jgi:hypothetical protein
MPTEWTIETLKEHLELQITGLRDREKIRGEALKLQADEYERRLTALNGEQARIAANQSASVSREIWDSSQREDRAWKSRIEGSISSSLPRVEFQTYKDTTDKALQLKAGQSQGIGAVGAIVVQVLTSLAGMAAIATVIVLLLRK